MKVTKKSIQETSQELGGGMVICGTDFTPQADDAVSAAAAIAKRLGVALLLVHVCDPKALFGSDGKLQAQRRAVALEKLSGVVSRLREQNVLAQAEFCEGRPEAELARLAAKPGVRLVVLASIGHVAISRILIGSVAERTAEASPAPTLVVRNAAPLLEWIEGKRPLNVFISGDFTASSETAIRWVKELRRIGACQVVLGHVDWPAESRRRFGAHSAEPSGGNVPELHAVLERDLKEKLHELLKDTSARVRVTPSWGKPDYNLIQLACEEQADLMVVGSHQRQGLSRMLFPSVSRNVLHHAPMNVACVPQTCAVDPSESPIPEFKRALVTTDFSSLANHAIPFAYSALVGGGTVRILHVLPLIESSDPTPHSRKRKNAKRGSADAQLDSITSKLHSLVPSCATASGVVSEFVVLRGVDAATIICEEAERFGADLVCIGSHGYSGFKASVLGSVTQKVAALTTKPLFIVKLPAP